MNEVMRGLLKFDEQVEAAMLPGSPRRFATLLERHDVRLVLWAPQDPDSQKPHDQDEIYIISCGSGSFRCDGQLVEYRAGDVLFVPAGADHCFERFSADCRTWVIFFGPKRGRS